ncbi:MAG: hypothetical protein Ct9H300mP6_09380 [Gammaproteobacteria bacterium]|nr:MAG: hypothetical protein Ct9H300mP6_09380 [Gammaproteobacteria bacterium]
MEQIKKDIIRIIKKRHQGKEDITVIRQDSVMKSFDNIFNVLTMALGSIASISLFVAGILIMNVMLVAVSSAKQKLGCLKLSVQKKIRSTTYLLPKLLSCQGLEHYWV